MPPDDGKRDRLRLDYWSKSGGRLRLRCSARTGVLLGGGIVAGVFVATLAFAAVVFASGTEHTSLPQWTFKTGMVVQTIN